MKKNTIPVILFLIGIILLLAGLILTFTQINAKDIIGGSDMHILLFVFFNENGGICFYLMLLGMVGIIASIIIRRILK